jgi:hypothetical protein
VGFLGTYLLDNVQEDSIKDMKSTQLYNMFNPFVYFYWIIESQLVMNRYYFSRYQFQVKILFTIIHVLIGSVIYFIAKNAEYRVNNENLKKQKKSILK